MFLLRLFNPRPDAPWVGYLPVLVVTALFTLYGLHDEIPWHFLALLVVCILQLAYRTLAGWGLLLGLCVAYGIALLVHPGRNAWGEYAFFAICGFLPAVALLVWRPRPLWINPSATTADSSR